MGILIKELNMEYKEGLKSLDNINLSIKEGIYGILGENGAGKSTLMKILVTLLSPTSGTVEMNNIRLEKRNYSKIKKIIGYLPQELGMYPNLTVNESLEYVGIMSGLSKKDCKSQIDYYLDKTGLTDQKYKKNKNLSGGMKRRVGLIQALLHNPSILIVDEPTAGLDPEERIRIRNLLVDFAKGRTVLFSTHVTEDLVATCEKLCIMSRGKVVYDGVLSDLIYSAKNHVFTCTFNNERDFLKFQQNYRITSKIYKADAIEVRFVSEYIPNIECYTCEPSLEDAYIYYLYINEKAAKV